MRYNDLIVRTAVVAAATGVWEQERPRANRQQMFHLFEYFGREEWEHEASTDDFQFCPVL